MRKILALLALLALVSPAEAQKTKAAITTEINSFFADNTTGQITPARLRTVTTDIVNSYVDWLSCAGTGGIVYWSAGVPTCLDAGTAGYVLRTNGPAAPPSWLSLSALVTINAGNSIVVTGTNPYTIALSTTPVLGDATGTSIALTGTSANIFSAGPSGSTNPTFNVDASTASAATGLRVKSAAAGGGLALSTLSSGTNENLALDAKGSGTITLGGVSTGSVVISRALTYGGVTLSNAVTGTGNMVLSASPTFSGSIGGTGVVPAAALANTAVTPGSYGSAAVVATFTVDQQGRLTAASNATINAVNGMAVTACTSCTLAVASNKTATISNTLTFTGTDSSSVAFGAGGTVSYTVASGTIALGTSAISASACATAVTASATGTATTDVIDVGFNGDPTAVTGYTAGAMLSIIPYPTANTVNVKVCNNTGASITPGAVTLNWRVRR